MNNKLTITTSDLVSTLMVSTNRTKIAIEDVKKLLEYLKDEIKLQDIDVTIDCNKSTLISFLQEYSEQFYVASNYIYLKQGYNINWLIENFISKLSFEKLRLLGFINLQNNTIENSQNNFHDNQDEDEYEFEIVKPYQVIEIEDRHPSFNEPIL